MRLWGQPGDRQVACLKQGEPFTLGDLLQINVVLPRWPLLDLAPVPLSLIVGTLSPHPAH